MSSQSQIKIQGVLSPLGDDITTGLCLYWTLKFSGDLGDEFVLFRRGKTGQQHSLKFGLSKVDPINRTPVLEVIFLSKDGKTEKKIFRKDEI